MLAQATIYASIKVTQKNKTGANNCSKTSAGQTLTASSGTLQLSTFAVANDPSDWHHIVTQYHRPFLGVLRHRAAPIRL